jgi:hypothetical protein
MSEGDETFFHNLGLFLHLEDRTVEEALPVLLEIFRDYGGPLEMVADMIDPGMRIGGWKLELVRKVRGAPRRRGSPDCVLLGEYCALRKKGGEKPVADAYAELAHRHYGRSDEKVLTAIDSAVRRARRKYKAATGKDPLHDHDLHNDTMFGSAHQMKAKLKALKKEIEEVIEQYEPRWAKFESKPQRRRAKIASKRRARRRSSVDLRQPKGQ